MAEWLFEAGIGEQRAALIDDDGRIVRARIAADGAGPMPGLIAPARLIERSLARLDSGEEVALSRPPAGVTLGAAIRVEITRAAIPEPGRPKLPRGRSTDVSARPAPTLRERLTDAPVRELRPHEPDALEAAGWSEVLEEALTGDISFPGGMLRFWPTPAMALFDVDGDPPLDSLAVRAAGAVAAAIERLDIGGSIGIDFPTLAGRDARHAVAAALDSRLPQPFERTAVNGFGFLQIVRGRFHPSVAEILRADPIGAAARAALRQIERTPASSSNRFRLPAAVRDRITGRPDWIAALVQRTGRTPIFDE
ncbi:ribonuclease [Sphingomonas sp. IC-11]|uniref:ribonuclease n=1 Tax=Sphingomonas sp. IC-11 TaxID=2898528 RepID=UPI001E4699D9|nr:ribonuclease [Sphingomonas sp. IC-11]MCD2316686.1 ribonuclease [Sphingomonas sp. IC-11]